MALGMSDRSSTSSRRWSGCSARTLPAQPMRRVVVSLPGPGHHVHVGEDLLAGEPPGGAGLVLELGVEQLGHEVVGGVVGAPVDVLGERLAGGEAAPASTASACRARSAARRRSCRGSSPGPPRGCRAACRSPASASGRPGPARSRSRPAPTSGSRLLAQNSRTFGSSAFILRGVNTRDSRPRWTVWTGGSSKMRTPGGISMPARISSRMPPRPEMKVSRSWSPRWTSSNRLSAKKSCCSL